MDGINSCLFLVPLIIVISFIVFLIRRKKVSRSGFLINVLIIVYTIIILDKTLFPIPFSATDIEIERNVYAGTPFFNIIPFKSILSMITNNIPLRELIIQVGGNIALFIPLGFLIIWKLHSRTPKMQIAKTVFVCAIFSASIEIIQLLLSVSFGYSFRFADIDDIILNIIGGVLGALAYIVILPLIKILFSKSSKKVVSTTEDSSRFM